MEGFFEGIVVKMGSKWRIKLYIAFALIAVAIVLCPSSMPTKMPVYRGRTIDQWYVEFAAPENPPEVRAPAEQVLREMGTNWTPSLIERFRDVQDSAIKLKLMSLAGRQSWIKFSFTTAAMRRESAMSEFVFWGPGTAAAVPELIKLSRDANADVAIVALRGLGIANVTATKPIIEPIIQAAASTNIPERQTAFLVICQVYQNWMNRPDATNVESFPAHAVTAVLLAGVNDPNLQLRVLAIDKLRHLLLEPEVVVPVLAGLLQDRNATVRFSAVLALGDYGAAARPAVPALKTALQDPDKSITNQAAISLKKIEAELSSTNSVALQRQTK